MSQAEQDKVFGRAGAQAIRDGADMGQVVNARRGMYTAGRLRVAATREGTTVRGLYGGYEIDPVTGQLRRRKASEMERRRSGGRHISGTRSIRLMPEQIYLDAGNDRAEAIRLLRRFGYLR